MGKRLPHTPNSQIKSSLRKLFLRSREHQAVLKRDGYTCQKCHTKQTKAKGKEVYVQVHHRSTQISWNKLFAVIRQELLVNPSEMETLCDACHNSCH